jgi:hypothetical protein
MASATQHEEMLAAFPYPPYEIQQQLMINVYEALQNKQIGLFESPTGAILRSTCAEQVLLLLQCLLLLTPCCNPAGTGKTLSIICSTLKWLEDERQAQAAAAAAAAAAAKAAGGVHLEKATHACVCPHAHYNQCQHIARSMHSSLFQALCLLCMQMRTQLCLIGCRALALPQLQHSQNSSQHQKSSSR